jgi:hypothetical protein
MPLSGDVRINQDGVVPTVFDLANSDAFAVGVVDLNGDQLAGFDESRPAVAALTSVAQVVVTGVLLAANPDRKQFLIFNAGTKPLFVAFAATASLAAYTLQIPTNGFYESPENGYTGVISGIWNGAGGGAAKVTEVTL